MKVYLDGHLLAESDKTVVVEGNHYFPPDAIKKEGLTDSDTHTHCPWKGEASYYNIGFDGKVVEDVAWYYPQASEKAKNIEGYVAFYKNKVKFEE